MANNKPTFALLPGQSTLNPAQQNQLIQSFKNKSGQGTVSVQWQDITNKPAVFPNAAHTHSENEILNLKQDLLRNVTQTVPATTSSLGTIIVGSGLIVNSLGLLSAVKGVLRVNNIVPSGAIDGINKVFTLPSVPVPGTEEVFMGIGRVFPASDYTISGAIITFIQGVQPATGDSIHASYFLSVVTGNRVNNEIPSGTIDGSNLIFSLASLPIISTEEIYVGAGRAFPTTDYTISGTTITFVSGSQPLLGDSIHANYFLVFVIENRVNNEVPTGTVDGSNRFFSLSSLPIAFTEEIYVGAGRAFPFQDYTLSGTTITFVSGSQPQAGDSIHASYFK